MVNHLKEAPTIHSTYTMPRLEVMLILQPLEVNDRKGSESHEWNPKA